MTDTSVSSRATFLRISVRAHQAAGDPGLFVCDRIVDVSKGAPSLQVPLSRVPNAMFVDYLVEGFFTSAMGVFRVASGSLMGVDAQHPNTAPSLVLYETETFRCGDAALAMPRAFHSATRLPNGQVFIYGGVVSNPPPLAQLDPQDRMYLANSAEVYDPSTGLITQVMDPAPGPVRAFHHAAVVATDPGSYRIVLVGGITVPGPGDEALAPNNGSSRSRLGVIDTNNPRAKWILTTQGAGAEVIVYSPQTKSILSHTPMPGYTPGGFRGGYATANGVVVAAGVDHQGVGDPPRPVNQVFAQATPTMVRMGVTTNARMGATLTPLGPDTALLWGGALATTDPMGEYVINVGLTGNPATNTTIPAPVGSLMPMTQFHTAAALDTNASGTRVLISGGFTVDPGVNGLSRQPPATDQAAQLLDITPTGLLRSATAQLPGGGYTNDPACAAPTRYRPGGYEASVRLPRPDGSVRVLITGGTPAYTVDVTGRELCNNCEDGSKGLTCGLRQASLYSRTRGLVPSSADFMNERMQVGRMGHTMTVLDDGNVLIVGGIGRLPDPAPPRTLVTHTLSDVEVFDPKTLVPPYDPTTKLDLDDPIYGDLTLTLPNLTRAPLDVARRPNGDPVSVCGVL